MIDDLLDTARVVAGKLRLQMEPVDLVPIVNAALEVVAPAANAKGIIITRRLDPNTPRVLGDADRLQQVLWNLLSNAVKFTDKGGTIDLRLEQVGDSTRITVEDDGKGIDPSFLPFVFERFRQQTDASSATRESGLGIGLALVKELVTLHGGTISAASPGPDAGSTFVISLPAIGAESGERG
jgi:signal transduction histidine kinase